MWLTAAGKHMHSCLPCYHSVVEVVDGGTSSITSSENMIMTEMASGAGLNKGIRGGAVRL